MVIVGLMIRFASHALPVHSNRTSLPQLLCRSHGALGIVGGQHARATIEIDVGSDAGAWTELID